MYMIQPHTRRKAREHGVQIRISSRKGKKIDVYKNGEFVVAIGSLHMSDYPTYIKSHGRIYAEKRRRAYHARSKGNTGPAGFYARKLLW